MGKSQKNTFIFFTIVIGELMAGIVSVASYCGGEERVGEGMKERKIQKHFRFHKKKKKNSQKTAHTASDSGTDSVKIISRSTPNSDQIQYGLNQDPFQIQIRSTPD